MCLFITDLRTNGSSLVNLALHPIDTLYIGYNRFKYRAYTLI